MKPLTPKEQIEKAKQESAFAQMGKQVIDNAAYKQVFLVRRSQIFEIFCLTKKDQEDVRDEAWRTMQNLNALEEFFNQALTTGKMADQTLESLKEE